MTVSIYSREKVIELLNTNFPENTAVISFSDPGTLPVDYHQRPVRLFQVAIHDADLSYLPKCGLTYETYFPEATDLAAFIYETNNDNLDILCQCEYGESRSAACAAAISEHFHHNGLSIFTDYRYYPNQVVYHKVFEALENHKKMEKKHTREYYFVIAEKKANKIEYLGLYDNERTARRAFLDFSKELNREKCDEIYSIISFINEPNSEQCIFEYKPSQMKWHQIGDKEF